MKSLYPLIAMAYGSGLQILDSTTSVRRNEDKQPDQYDLDRIEKAKTKRERKRLNRQVIDNQKQ